MESTGTRSEEQRAAASSPVSRASSLVPRVDWLADLNDPQREAVTHGEGPLLILAGPGSGKTRVITRRVAWLIADRHVAPWELIAITFTNKAAREMRERVEHMLPAQGVWISTFHSTCARILRREIEALGGFTRDFSIYDTHDRNQLLKNLIKEANYDLTRFKPSLVGAWISEWKNQGYAEGAHEPSDDDLGIEHEVLVKIRRAYDEAMRKSNALDFDDLLLRVLELFDSHTHVRDAYSRRFRYVMVDEYQDTNRVQYLLTRHLAHAHGNLTVCGDPDQSIYAWRGADVRNILDFEHDFGSPLVVKLEQNYRSTGTILKAAQALISNNRRRKEKRIWTAAGDGHSIVITRCADENDEAEEIAKEVRRFLAAGRTANEIAVFYRVNFMQRALESALRLARIPYQVVAGVEFYERREIRDLIAYLKLIVNPRDDVSFRRVVNTPSRGIGEKSLEVLSSWAADRRVSLMEALRSSEALQLVRGRARAGLQSFHDLMVKLAPAADEPAAFAIDRLLEEIDYDAWIAEIEDPLGADREANVDELRSHAATYDRSSATTLEPATGGNSDDAPPAGLRGFLQDIALVSDTDDLETDRDKVTLMTLHSAKGLEFPIVFIAGVEEELLPHARALVEASDESGVEEERRLLYVGITRARESLHLTHASERMHFGQQSFRSPSRFLKEIPEELVDGHVADESEETMLGAFQQPASVPELCVGDRIEHDHFGRGTIERLAGAGVNARATVYFAQAGTKELLLAYAKLKRIGKGAP